MARRARRHWMLMALVAAAAVTPSAAVEDLTLSIARLRGSGWAGDDLLLRLNFPAPGRVSVLLEARKLTLPRPFQSVRGARLHCPEGRAVQAGVHCAAAELTLLDEESGKHVSDLAVDLVQEGDRWRLHFHELPWLEGKLELDAHTGPRGWELRLRGAALSAAALWRVLAGLRPLPGLQGDGRVDLSVAMEGDSRVRGLVLEAGATALTFSDASGLHAGEGVSVRLSVDAEPAGDDWQGRLSLVVPAGQMYFHPIFVDAGATPLAVDLQGQFAPRGGALRLSEIRLRQAGVMALEAELDGRVGTDGALEGIRASLARTGLGPLYDQYLEPFAVADGLGTHRAEGEVDARLIWDKDTGVQVEAGFHDAGLDDDAGRFRIDGLGGRASWRQRGEPAASTLSWKGGQFYRLPFGAGSIHGVLAGDGFTIQRPLVLPMLGGALQVEDLRVTGMGTPALAWRFRATLEPMSLSALTDTLAWPPFGGTIAGAIPLVSFADGVVSVDGSLAMEVFDGRVVVRNLSIENPFDVIPVLRADVDMQGLSLDALTSTFSFGNIRGRLDGSVHGLVLEDWQPTAFDARFRTPEGDGSRRRISQRAVRDLASLGGAGAILSSTVLSLFEEFSYRRLGISCRLADGICHMDGVAPAERGYYIVEGGGLPPRIDVLGFNKRVDWQVLLSRLGQIVAHEAPTVR